MFMIVYGYLCLQHFNMNLLKKAAGAGENPEPQRLWMKKAFLTYNTQGSRGWGSHLRELLSMQRPGKCALSGFQLSPAIWGSYRELRFDSHCHSWPYLLINTHKPSCSFPYLMLRHILGRKPYLSTRKLIDSQSFPEHPLELWNHGKRRMNPDPRWYTALVIGQGSKAASRSPKRKHSQVRWCTSVTPAPRGGHSRRSMS
jgi:hypothetical protein